MKRIALALVLASLMLSVASAKDNDPCTSTSDCDMGEWCEGFRCKYYSCSTDADCPECGRCVSGACFRDGGCIPGSGSGVNPADLIAPMQPVEPIEGITGGPLEPAQQLPWMYIGIIAVLALVIIVLLVKRK